MDNLARTLRVTLLVVFVACIAFLTYATITTVTGSGSQGETIDREAEGIIPEGKRAGYIPGYRDMCKREPESVLCRKQ